MRLQAKWSNEVNLISNQFQNYRPNIKGMLNKKKLNCCFDFFHFKKIDYWPVILFNLGSAIVNNVHSIYFG